MEDQNHPLYSIDRDHIDRMLAKNSPVDQDLVDLARLIIRYEGFPGALDLKEDMEKIMHAWGLSRTSLNKLTREIWEGGFRPGNQDGQTVGSGFDTSDSDLT